MVKGAAKLESDIDGYLFIAIDELPKVDKEDVAIQDDISDHGFLTTSLTPYYKDKYSILLRDGLKTKLNLKDEQVGHARVLAINAEQRFNQERDLEEQEFRKAHPDEIFFRKLRPENLPLPFASVNLTALFHLDVGGKIGSYRAEVVNKLKQQGQAGEQAWKYIIEGTESIEQNLSTNTNKLYPRSVSADSARSASSVYLNTPSRVCVINKIEFIVFSEYLFHMITMIERSKDLVKKITRSVVRQEQKYVLHAGQDRLLSLYQQRLISQ